MEHTVLCMLDFKVSVRTSYYFATRLALAAEMTEKEQSFMFFLLGTYAYVQTVSYVGHDDCTTKFIFNAVSLTSCKSWIFPQLVVKLHFTSQIDYLLILILQQQVFVTLCYTWLDWIVFLSFTVSLLLPMAIHHLQTFPPASHYQFDNHFTYIIYSSLYCFLNLPLTFLFLFFFSCTQRSL